jgi:hypothetical protein
MRLAVLCLVLSSCGPVLFEDPPRAQDAGVSIHLPGMRSDEASASVDPAAPRDRPGPLPTVSVRITASDCGRCFVLQAEASSGRPPYEFEWEDGSHGAVRRVCVENVDATLTVAVRDAAALRSETHWIHLQGLEDAGCPEPEPPMEPEPKPTACLMNLSFEGTPAANFGQAGDFDATPWSTCAGPGEVNTPDIGNDTVAQTLGPIPKPTDGKTFLALGEGEQVSQEFCSPLADAPLSFEMDLTRLNIGAGLVPETEEVFLEIWGGLSVDCSRRELLWLSPALRMGWERYCVTLRPHAYMTQIVLRATADMTLGTPAYLAVDNLKPVESCP